MSNDSDQGISARATCAGIGIIVACNGGIGRAVLNLLEQQRSLDKVVGLSRDSTPRLDLLFESSIADSAGTIGAVERRLNSFQNYLPIELRGSSVGDLHVVA